MSPSSRTIFVIGASGAQGSAVVRGLLKPNEDGTPSPWRVRALTRDATSESAQKLVQLGVELVQGSFTDDAAVERGMTDAYGAFVNTDGGHVGASGELFAGIRIYEIAQRAGVKHFVYSSLDHVLKNGNWNPQYAADNYLGKARVAEYIKAQPSNPTEGMWTILNSTAYLDMVAWGFFAPMNTRPDGTVVFAAPVGDAKVPLIALDDFSFWSRYIFDSPASTVSAQTLNVASDVITWPELVETFIRITGKRATYTRLTIDEWFALFPNADDWADETHTATFRSKYGAFWATLRDEMQMERDMEWVKSVFPGVTSVEGWMKKTRYDGTRAADGRKKKGIVPDMTKIVEL